MQQCLSKLRINPSGASATHTQIREFLEDNIRDGCLSPGNRLPSTAELAEMWRVSPVSVQKAMTELKAHGFIERRMPYGTFVRSVERDTTIAILAGNRLINETAYYQRMLVACLFEELAGRSWKSILYDGFDVGNSSEEVQTLSRNRFIADAKRHLFSGLVMIGMGSPDFEDMAPQTGLPTVRISTVLKFSDVTYDGYQFGWDVMEWASRNGFRRVACMGMNEDQRGVGVQAGAARFNLLVSHTDMGGVVLDKVVYDQTMAMIDDWARRNEYPEALVVRDDVAMRSVALALAHRQVQVPQQLKVLTLATKGTQIHYGIPVTRYQFSPQEEASVAMSILWKRILHEAPPQVPVLLRGKIIEDQFSGGGPGQTTSVGALV